MDACTHMPAYMHTCMHVHARMHFKRTLRADTKGREHEREVAVEKCFDVVVGACIEVLTRLLVLGGCARSYVMSCYVMLCSNRLLFFGLS